jgi:hypothetical protein
VAERLFSIFESVSESLLAAELGIRLEQVYSAALAEKGGEWQTSAMKMD